MASFIAVCVFFAVSVAGGSASAGPVFSTTPSTTSVTLGGPPVTLQDTAYLYGLSGTNPTGTITFHLVYNGTTVDTEQVRVTGISGSYSTPFGYTLPTFGGTVTGTYQWNADYSGDANNLPILDDDNPAEQVTVNPASPTLSATPSTDSVTLGGPSTPLQDNAVLSGSADNAGGTITFTLVYDGNTVDTEHVLVSGDGMYSTLSGYTLPTFGGTVTGTYQWNATYDGDGNNNSASDDNDSAEQVTVSPASPSISVMPNTTDVTLGGPPVTLRDDVQLSDGYNPGGTITFTLIGPGGTTVDTEHALVSGNGLYSTPSGYTPAVPYAAGSYQWNVSYGGDTNNNAASDDNDASEQVTVNAATPTISTTPSSPSVTLGPPVNLEDTAFLSGGFFPLGYITFNLLGPDGKTVVDSEMVLVNGDGPYSTPTGYTPTAAGTYQWNASYSGDFNNTPAADLGASTEQVTVSAATPSIATTQQPASAAVGSSIADQATLFDGSSPTGTVTFDLYSNSNATGTPVFTDTESVSVGSATSADYTPTAPGTYYWVATYNGDSGNNAVTSGTADEPVTVTLATPSIGTTPEPASATLHSPMADQANVSGGYDPTGTVTFVLYSNSSGTGSPLFADTEPLSGGTATSAGYTPTSTGTVYWVATYNGDSNNDAVSSGTADEPVTVSLPPAPSNTALPVISKPLVDGLWVKAAKGAWSSSETLTYGFQWQRCDAAGASCQDLVGATSQAYKLSSLDVGHRLRVVVTATDDESQAGHATSPASPVVAAPAAPLNTAAPSISGLVEDGKWLKAVLGSWSSPDHLAFSYVWQRCDSLGQNCVNVGTASAYRPSSLDVGGTVELTVTATDLEGQASSAAPLLTGVVAAPAAPLNTVAPSISGTLAKNNWLVALRGSWSSPDKLVYSYEWQRCNSSGLACVTVATTQAYRTSSLDVGHTLDLTMTVTDAEGQSTPFDLGPTAVITG